MIRLFVPDPLHVDAGVTPSDDQARYLVTVMRQGVGDAVLLFNGVDGEWRARLTEVSRRSCRLRVEAQIRGQGFPPDLDLIIALVKRSRLETIVEKAAELGVRRIRPVTTRRTNADHTNAVRLQAIAVEASEQTGRLDVPLVAEPEALSAMIDGWDPTRRLMFCDEAGDDPHASWGGATGRAQPVLEVLTPPPPGARPEAFAILIGPEGGFAPEERDWLRGLSFVTAVTLGPRILRADTAAIAALTLWQAAIGDWRALSPQNTGS